MTDSFQNRSVLRVVFGESPKHVFNPKRTPGTDPEESKLDVSALVLEQEASQAPLA